MLAASDPDGASIEPVDPALAAKLLDAARLGEDEGSIGPYRILRTLGQGGMGTVFLAERVEGGFEQRVALKLIKRGMDSEAILERFRQERQILARLQHDGIARLLDGGMSNDGRPFFAMELVVGEPIGAYADRHRLTTEDRLELFAQVCEAVEHAHRNLVVHRDLKPSNILVTEDGLVKLVDFGIAKVLEPGDQDGDGDLTRQGPRPLTPLYASPEQVRGESLTTLADVYALGVNLYQLLTGQPPYGVTGTTPRELAEAICDRDPVAPSMVLARSPDTAAHALPRIDPDLDSIVLKALAKEPERRYASAAALSEDLRRHRDGLPVLARAPSRLYRTTKFLRRHRLGVAVASLAVLALVLGLAGSLWQANVASAERDRARQEAAKADEVRGFLLELFAVSDPSSARGDTVTARELLDRGTLRLQTELAEQPEVKAEMMAVVGEIYRLLGLNSQARPLLEQALSIRQQSPDGEPDDVAASLGALAALSFAEGSYEDSEKLYRHALELEELAGRGEQLEAARLLNGLSVTVRARGQYDEAESLARRALTVRRRSLGAAHLEVAESLRDVAVPLYLKTEYAEAELLYQEALAMLQGLYGDEHREVAVLRNRLGLLYRRQGRHEESEASYRQALSIYQHLLGEAHPDVAMVLSNIAQSRQVQGDLDEAERLYRQALAGLREVLRPGHPDISMVLSNLASLLNEKQDHAGALLLARESLEIVRRAHGEDHPYVAYALGNLGFTYYRMGDLESAESSFRGALEVQRHLFPEDDPRVIATAKWLERIERERTAGS